MSKRKPQSVNRMLKRGNAEAKVNFETQTVEIWKRTKRSRKFIQLHSVIPAGSAIEEVMSKLGGEHVGENAS